VGVIRLSRDFPFAAVAGVGGLTALAWLDLLHRASAMATGAGMDMGTGMGMSMAMAMPRPLPWDLPDLLAAGSMWSVMMTAMMLPSAFPVLFLVSAVQRSRMARTRGPSAALFAAGFLLIWVVWSWFAAGLQWALQAWLALSPHLTVARFPLAVAFLVLAGLYQFTPLKHACLARCQSPLGFLLTRWRHGPWAGLQMGASFGAYCVGCCWALMGLLFVVGVMNLLWIAALAIFVLVEKTVRGPWLGRATGVALLAWALYLLVVGSFGVVRLQA
jgi:predicted metal-binding membrane protein